jgi:hypothetical protein
MSSSGIGPLENGPTYLKVRESGRLPFFTFAMAGASQMRCQCNRAEFLRFCKVFVEKSPCRHAPVSDGGG